VLFGTYISKLGASVKRQSMKTIFTLLIFLLSIFVNGQVHVKGYYRSNGTYVQPHERTSPNSTKTDNYSYPGNYNPSTGTNTGGNTYNYNSSGQSNSTGDVWVEGYYKNDGTYAKGHYRSAANGDPYDNYSYPGNTNPYTGKTATGNPSTYLKNYYVNSTTLNVRKGPSTDYSVMTTLNYGDNIEVVEDANANWKKVKITYVDNQTSTLKSDYGYVHGDFVTMNTNSNLNATNNHTPLNNTRYVNKANLNVRKDASINSDIITTLNQGDKVEIIEYANVDWAKVQVSYYNNEFKFVSQTGYVYLDYLTDMDPKVAIALDMPDLDRQERETEEILFQVYHPYGLNNGMVSIWTDCGADGEISIYIDDIYVGKLTQYIKDGSTPQCGNAALLPITKKEGTYKILAKGSTKKWEGTIVVTADKCTTQKLIK
jgi:uncharacterized protein YgiM (DUF1202 family)